MNSRESILEATLVLFDAKQYLKNFRSFGIDSSVLPLLTANDLQIVGIENADLRTKLLKQFAHLPLPKQFQQKELVVNDAYFIDIINEINRHLILLNASLCYAVNQGKGHAKGHATLRQSNIRLKNVAKCLVHCAHTFHNQVFYFGNMFTVVPMQSKHLCVRKRKWKYIVCVVVSCTAAYSLLRNVFKNNAV